jgi:IMP cyclohydrolase
MYIGRIVAVGMTPGNKAAAMYRVSSRSFPNREARINEKTVSIMPRKGFEDDLNKSPYIAYNCIKLAGDCAIATNGSHTDPITEKIASGMSVRDSLTLSLLAMDYEKDSYDTPRIAAVADRKKSTGFLGIVRKDAIIVREFELKPGIAFYVATYEKNTPSNHCVDELFDASSAKDACEFVVGKGVFSDFEHPVTSAAAVAADDSFEIAVKVV